ncbi:MAG: fasciclin domain-containing protein [Blastocatellia bacterium]|nr:fasciclin domain-containing protein [Blastocatellia bacterium]
MLNVIETISASPVLTTLRAAIQAAQWEERFSRQGLITVFAPTNEAFAKLPQGSLQEVFQHLPQVQEMLAYHFIEGAMLVAEITKYASLQTFQGKNVGIAVNNGIKVNQANVISADIACENGIIHILDAVLTMPNRKFTVA